VSSDAHVQFHSEFSFTRHSSSAEVLAFPIQESASRKPPTVSRLMNRSAASSSSAEEPVVQWQRLPTPQQPVAGR
jgi:hypothetical protein